MKVKYIECVGTTPNVSYKPAYVQDLDTNANKNFHNLADLDKHLEDLLDIYIKASGYEGACIWKSNNWGKPKEFFYWHICLNDNIYVNGRCQYKTITIE